MNHKSGLAFHVHHDRLVEYCYDYDERVRAIKKDKPANEIATRLRLFRLLPDSVVLPKDLKKAEAEWKKAYAEWKKAEAEWKKADVEWEKAEAERKKAEAEWKKAEAEWKKAYAEWKKAEAEWKKAYAEWKKAYVEREKADAERQKAEAALDKAVSRNLEFFKKLHAELCSCKEWNGKEIVFPK